MPTAVPQITSSALKREVKKLEKFLKGPMNEFERPREENEVDVVAEVRDALIRNGIGDRIRYFDNDPLIIDAIHLNSIAQTSQLNRWFTQQLFTVPNTHNDRGHLLLCVSGREWLGIFETRILPNFIGYGLPVFNGHE